MKDDRGRTNKYIYFVYRYTFLVIILGIYGWLPKLLRLGNESEWMKCNYINKYK